MSNNKNSRIEQPANQERFAVAIVTDPSDPMQRSGPCQWALGELADSLTGRGIVSHRYDELAAVRRETIRILIQPVSEDIKEELAEAESFSIRPVGVEGARSLIVQAADSRGLVYAVTELADRASNSTDERDVFGVDQPIIERPTAKIRSISKCYESELEDKDWFHDRAAWEAYFSMLVSQRFNRFALTLGMQYNYPYGNEFITDTYFYLAYPFLVSVPGHDVRAVGLSDEERDRNLETLKFIGRAAAERGLDFQLALWTQRYDFDDCPNATYQIAGAREERHAAYCRDALALILKACHEITGLTLRVHVESGIAEGQYDFWRTYFEAVTGCGRPIELDLHAKGVDQQMIDLALATGMAVNISPKYTLEHMGLPYHQASIRAFEMPRGETVDKKWTFSEGSRRFLRYSYGDLLKEDRQYGVVYRIWPGTQRVLLWGDPALAGGYGRSSTYCGSLGVELCEPLSFKGRMGTGIAGGRGNYLDRDLVPDRDWQKYLQTYRVWGRLIYCPDTACETWRRALRKQFGAAGDDCDIALANASRVLPLFTLAHAPSASNNSWWPEIYENMSIVKEAPWLPYAYDMLKPARFGTVTACDPQLFSSPEEFIDSLLSTTPSGKYSPLSVASWLEGCAARAERHIALARAAVGQETPAFRRLWVDVTIQSALARFFAAKFRSACFWETYLKSGAPMAAEEALSAYRRALDAWAIAADVSRGVYLSDITYGPQSWLRGCWDDRLPAIEDDVAAMAKMVAEESVKNSPSKSATSAQGEALAQALLNWREAERQRCIHHPAKHFTPTAPLPIYFSLETDQRPVARLHYRHVNQAEPWQVKDMQWRGDRCRAEISGAYTDSPYPLQYYFELITGERASLFPGLDKDLANEPYFTVRQNRS